MRRRWRPKVPPAPSDVVLACDAELQHQRRAKTQSAHTFDHALQVVARPRECRVRGSPLELASGQQRLIGTSVYSCGVLGAEGWPCAPCRKRSNE